MAFFFGKWPVVLKYIFEQHEVAFRLIAPTGATERSRLSVMAQNYATVKYLYTLKGGAFVPKPKVGINVENKCA